jgi:hypothetical protein
MNDAEVLSVFWGCYCFCYQYYSIYSKSYRIQYLYDQRVARYNFPYVKMLSVTCIVVYSITL